MLNYEKLSDKTAKKIEADRKNNVLSGAAFCEDGVVRDINKNL